MEEMDEVGRESWEGECFLGSYLDFSFYWFLVSISLFIGFYFYLTSDIKGIRTIIILALSGL